LPSPPLPAFYIYYKYQHFLSHLHSFSNPFSLHLHTMAIPKIIPCLVAMSLLVLCFVEADDMIVEELVHRGANYLQGRTCARGHVARAVHVAAACRRALPETMGLALATRN
uniref:Uncharacterized protein n=1 Tax=Cucumis melo TaxID=3656 RepID=A0A9I9CHP5_CUCME